MKLRHIILLLIGFSSFATAQEIRSEFNKEVKLQKKLSYILDIPQDIKTKIVTVASKGISDMIPPETNKVRVPEMSASWNFTPKVDGTVDGEYQLFVDPGGDIPSWIVNMFAGEGPYNSIINMKKMLTLDKYKSRE